MSGIYGNNIILNEGLFLLTNNSKFKKVEELIDKKNYDRAKKVLEKIKPKTEEEKKRYNELKDKIDKMEYEIKYKEYLSIVEKAFNWWKNPNKIVNDNYIFSVLNIAQVSDQKFISHLDKKVKKQTGYKYILNYLFGDGCDDEEYYNFILKSIKSKINNTDELFIFCGNGDYLAFINFTNKSIYDFNEKISKISLKELSNRELDSKLIKDILVKEKIEFK